MLFFNLGYKLNFIKNYYKQVGLLYKVISNKEDLLNL